MELTPSNFIPKSYQTKNISSPFNLFGDEEASLKNLRILIFNPVGFNSSKNIDPWHSSLLKIENGN